MAKTATVTKFPRVAISVEMKFKKETPGTYVYEDVSDDAPITTLYIRKDAMPNGATKIVSVTVAGNA